MRKPKTHKKTRTYFDLSPDALPGCDWASNVFWGILFVDEVRL
jgi:hypothetical protein